MFCKHFGHKGGCHISSCDCHKGVKPDHPQHSGREEMIAETVDSFAERWRMAHKIEGNNGKDVIYSLIYGLDVLSPWLKERLHSLVERVERESAKAYGGCTKCYGKGYATQLEFASGRHVHYQQPYYLPCSCDRGKQIAEMMERVEREILRDFEARFDGGCNCHVCYAHRVEVGRATIAAMRSARLEN